MQKWHTEPEISIIIPTYNRMDSLPHTLTAMELQDMPKELFEVLVIDDGSTDDTHAFLQRFNDITSLRYRHHSQTQQGAAAARNWGIENSCGQWALFLDADIRIHTDVVRRHWLRHKNSTHHSCCWMGRIDPSPELDRWRQYKWDEFAINVNGAPEMELSWNRYRTPNSSIALADLRKAGMFDPDFRVAEDGELAYRLHKSGMRFLYDDDIHGIHHHPVTFAQYMDKASEYGRAAAVWNRKHPENRAQLALHFGLYTPELPLRRKLWHLLKVLAVNRWTVPALKKAGLYWHAKRKECSIYLLTLVYRYQVRRAFRLGKNVQG